MYMLSVKKFTVISMFSLLVALWASAEESVTEICFDFRVNKTAIDSIYGDNAEEMRRLAEFADLLKNDSLVSIVSVSFCGTASPEGSDGLNVRLARSRRQTVEALVCSLIDIPDSIISRKDNHIRWGHLREMVAASSLDYKDAVIDIIDCEPELVEYRKGAFIDNRVLKLQKLDGGKRWGEINRLFFRQMREACAVFVTLRREPEPEPEPVPAVTAPIEIPAPTERPDTVCGLEKNTEMTDIIPVEVAEVCRRNFYVKTNGIGLAMAIFNVAVEADINCRWSVAVPFQWSGWDYFSSTTKFRVLGVQPEIRYWANDSHYGWFAGAHIGVAWYNCAVSNGNYRIQDRNGNRPAWGGGVAAGFRMPLGDTGKWRLEFSAGAGVYSLHYDKFRNKPNGLLVKSEKKVWFGIDQVAVSVAYTFDMKGGRIW